MCVWNQISLFYDIYDIGLEPTLVQYELILANLICNEPISK